MDVFICVEIASMKNEVVFVWGNFSVFFKFLFKGRRKGAFYYWSVKRWKVSAESIFMQPSDSFRLGLFFI